jgi:hypothetical protein
VVYEFMDEILLEDRFEVRLFPDFQRRNLAIVVDVCFVHIELRLLEVIG